MVLVEIAIVLERLGPMRARLDCDKRSAATPENARPKWTFSNIVAIGEDTDRILALLEGGADAGRA